MLNRLSVNFILKSVIASLMTIIIVALAIGAWDSWRRLTAVNRIAAVAEATSYMFTALHNLRVDRATTFRELNSDKPPAGITQQLKDARTADLPALKSAVVALEGVDFPERQAAVTDLAGRVKKLAALHEESVAAFLQPKAARRAGMAKEFFDETSALIDTLDTISSRLTRLVKLEDAYIDQLLEMKQLAWVVRNAGGDASVMISNALGGFGLPADPMLKYTANVAKADTAWSSLEGVAAGLPLPPRFAAAVEKAKKEFFGADLIALRDRTIKMLVAGEKPEMTTPQWTSMIVPKLGTTLGVAEVALDVAKDHAAEQRASAIWRLSVQVAFLAFAIAMAAGLMFVVSRRITRPLDMIQSGMRKLAGGDVTVEVPYAERKDEIGGLAGAMQAFKDSLIDADRLRGEQRETETRAASQRASEMQRLANEFQTTVGNIVEAVSAKSGELEIAAGTLTRTAESTQSLSGSAAAASEEASSNVQSVASAAEEMSASVNEIAQRVQESSNIAAEAVSQAQKTDARIAELSAAASRIGDVVKLITAIAEQTNLLALNATIEAARAGEAGRGVAVVASEVKALATQTAKATDEIGTQISAMQVATNDSVVAIKEIGSTIGRISEIAESIAASVQEQGAATQEISRNVQHAASGTAQVVTNINDVNRGASETGTASAQVLASAQFLASESGHLKAEVEKFVRTVRAA
jgi:methyl-accepting chemotaxis protein